MEDLDLRSIAQARRLLEAASGAAPGLAALSQEGIDAIVDAAAGAARARLEEWARLAVDETGFGNVADKTAKNRFAAERVHGHIRPMRTVGVLSRDDERRIVEIAAPAGIVAAIIPCTNPTSTAINKILIALKAACPIVVSPHPSAQRCVAEVCRVLGEAAEGAGAPPGSVGCMTEVALAGTRELMRHDRTAVILATGGTGLVRAAYSSGKPAFGVGPGNVPAYVDRSADVAKAARDIVNGKSFDHGVLCSAENAVVADAPVAGALRAAMESEGALFLDPAQTEALSRLAVTASGSINTAIVGRSALVIAGMAGIPAPSGTRCLVAPLQGVGPATPLSREKLSPILAFYVEEGWEAACARCLEILAYGGMGHTMSVHATDRDLIMRFGLTKPVFRIVVNSPAAIGAVGLTTGVDPSMTLGCGALGGNITSDNITPRHLINVKRLAFEVAPYEREGAAGPSPATAHPAHGAAVAPGAPRPGAPPRSLPILGASGPSSHQSPPHGPAARAMAPAPASPHSPRAPEIARSSHVPVPPGPPSVPSGPAVSAAELRRRIASILGTRALPASRPVPPPPDPAPPGSPIGKGAARPTPAPSGEPFVCEADVRRALDESRKITISARSIVTPSARDLGEQHRVFVKL